MILFLICLKSSFFSSGSEYAKTPIEDSIENWSDEKFWKELKKRLPHNAAKSLITGPSIEKSIAPLRSFVAEPMKYGSMFLVGDAAHIVPPTGAKGLNLAFSDVFYLHQAMNNYYNNKNKTAINLYSKKALKRAKVSIKSSSFLFFFLNISLRKILSSLLAL